MGKHPNPKPQTTRTQDPTQVLVGEGKRGKQRSQDPQMGTSLAGYVMKLSTLVRYLYKLGSFDTHPANLKDRGHNVVCIRGGRVVF